MTLKRILFDFLTFEDKFINGGALYAKTVLLNLLKRDCIIIGICEHVSRINPEILKIVKDYKIDIYENVNKIQNIVLKEKIDLFFIGITQRYNPYDLTSIECEIIGVCHDIGDIVMDEANILNSRYREEFDRIVKGNSIKSKFRSFGSKVKNKLKKILLQNKGNFNKLVLIHNYYNFACLLKKKNFHLVTVSNYSKNAIEYFFDDIANDITVLYPAEVTRDETVEVSNFDCLKLKKYFIILSCNRFNKNFINFYKSFKKFSKTNPEYYAIAIGLERTDESNIIFKKSVTDVDLKILFENCYALVYPSFNEGFGLPPLEAMKYSKPVLAAFDTSIPEVCGDSALYFNPSYPDDLYMKYKILVDNYDFYCKKSYKHYCYISEKRSQDMEKLINFILEEK